MIKKINTQGCGVLYKMTMPCAPLLEKTTAVESLSLANEEGGEEKISYRWPEHIINLITDLKDTAESIADNCLGLASTQIWDSSESCPSIFVMRWTDNTTKRGWKWQEIINPVMKPSGKTKKLEEGCLSYPNIVVQKKRKSNVTLFFQTLDDPRQKVAKLTYLQHGITTRIIQHEVDHLNGVCIRSRNFRR